MKVTLQSPIHISGTVVPVKMNLAIDGRYWDVEGEYNVGTNVFTPQLVGPFSVEQFTNDAKLDQTEFVEKVQNIFNKNRGW